MADAHRLFAAVDLSQTARAAVGDLTRAVSAALARAGSVRRIRWVAAEQLHLTLAFMAAVPDGQLADVTAAIAPGLPVEPFVLEFAGLGMFPVAGPPRVLWVGVGAGRPGLEALAAEVRRRLQGAGILMDDRPFAAHLTLGRWRESRRGDRDAVARAAPPGVIARCAVDHVTLYESALLADGAHHSVVIRSPLTRAPGGRGR